MHQLKKPVSVLLALLFVLSAVTVAFTALAAPDYTGLATALKKPGVKNGATGKDVNDKDYTIAYTVGGNSVKVNDPTGNIWKAAEIYFNAAKDLLQIENRTDGAIVSANDPFYRRTARNIGTAIYNTLNTSTYFTTNPSAADINLSDMMANWFSGNPDIYNTGTDKDGTNDTKGAQTSTFAVTRDNLEAVLIAECATLNDIPIELAKTQSYTYLHTEKTATWKTGSGTNAKNYTKYYHMIAAATDMKSTTTEWYNNDSDKKPAMYKANLTLYKNFFTDAVTGATAVSLFQMGSAGVKALLTEAKNIYDPVKDYAPALFTHFGLKEFSVVKGYIDRLEAVLEAFAYADYVAYFRSAKNTYTFTDMEYADLFELRTESTAQYNLLEPAYAKGGVRSVLEEVFGIKFAQIDLWRTELQVEIEVRELTVLKEYFDANMYPDVTQNPPTDDDLLDNLAEYATRYEQATGRNALNQPNYSTAALNRVFPTGTDYVGLYITAVEEELVLRGLDLAAIRLFKFFNPGRLAQDVTIMSRELLVAEYNLCKTKYVDFQNLDPVNRTRVFRQYEAKVPLYIDSLLKEMAKRLNASLAQAFGDYDKYGNKVTIANYQTVNKYLDKANSDTNEYHPLLVAAGLATYDTDGKIAYYVGKLGSVLTEYNTFKTAKGFIGTTGKDGYFKIDLIVDDPAKPGYPYPISVEHVGNMIKIGPFTDGKQYQVTEAKFNQILAKLDGFLTSKEFSKLLWDVAGMDLGALIKEKEADKPCPCGCGGVEKFCDPKYRCHSNCTCETCNPPPPKMCECGCGHEESKCNPKLPCCLECECGVCRGPITGGGGGEETVPVVIPEWNEGFFASLGTLVNDASTGRVAGRGIVAPGTKRYDIKADKADVFFGLLQWLLNAAGDERLVVSLLTNFLSEDDVVVPPVPCACGCDCGKECDGNGSCCDDCDCEVVPVPCACGCACGKECDGDGSCCEACTCKKPAEKCECGACECEEAKCGNSAAPCCAACKDPDCTGNYATIPQILPKLLDSLYSDDIVNMLVGMIYPMVAEIVNKEVGSNMSLIGEDNIPKLGLSVFPKHLAKKVDPKYKLVIDKLTAAGMKWDGSVMNVAEGTAKLDWTTTAGVKIHDQATFLDALGSALSGLAEVLAASLANKGYAGTHDVIIFIASVKTTLSAQRGFNDAILPLQELLDCPGRTSTSSLESQVSALVGNGTPTDNTKYNYKTTNLLINAMFAPLLNWITQVMANKPLDTILGILPNLNYAIIFDMIGEGFGKVLTTQLHLWTSGLASGLLSVDETIELSEQLDLKKMLLTDLLGMEKLDSLDGIFAFLFDALGIPAVTAEAAPVSNVPLPPVTIPDSMASILDIVKGVASQPDQVFASLVELLNPQKYAEADKLVYPTPAAVETEYTDEEGVAHPNNEVSYSDIWTKNHADYLNAHLDDFVNKTVELFLGKSLDETVYDLLAGLLDETGEMKSIYNRAMIDKVVDMVKGLLEGIDAETMDMVVSLAAGLVDVDGKPLEIQKLFDNINKYPANSPAFAEGDRDGFLNAVVTLLAPAIPLLEVFLTGKDVNLVKFTMNSTPTNMTKIFGYKGYGSAIIPILEAIGCKNVLTPTEYENAAADDPKNVILNLVNPILGILDDLLKDPTNTVMSILPNIIYFLGTDLLTECINNLLRPAYVLLDIVRPIYNLSLDLNFNLMVMLEDLFNGLVEDLGVQFNVPFIDLVNGFMVGTIEEYTSANGNTAAKRMVANNSDFLTVLFDQIINMLMYPQNNEATKALVKEYGKLDAGNLATVYKLLDKFQLMSVDTVKYVLFYLFYGANYAVDTTNAAIADANAWLKEVSKEIAASSNPSLQEAASKARFLLNKYFKDVIDPGDPGTKDPTVAPNGLVKFFYNILNFFRRIFGMDPLPYPV